MEDHQTHQSIAPPPQKWETGNSWENIIELPFLEKHVGTCFLILIGIMLMSYPLITPSDQQVCCLSHQFSYSNHHQSPYILSKVQQARVSGRLSHGLASVLCLWNRQTPRNTTDLWILEDEQMGVFQLVMGVPPIAGWFLSWKIPSKYGWELGVPLN